MTSLADRMRERGIEVEDTSLGSTPTAEYADEVEGVTEIRPGTYIFYDRMQARLGACSLEECAASVVATVVSRPSEDLAIIDGEAKPSPQICHRALDLSTSRGSDTSLATPTLFWRGLRRNTGCSG
jgi:hypothetical protein